MEILKQVQYMQTEEYVLKVKRKSFEKLCGYDLTDFQIGVLMANTVENSQTIYAAQRRGTGTSTALLLKIYQSIFLEGR
jgi:predicted DsbA family dithiol-disulfide isomerase